MEGFDAAIIEAVDDFMNHDTPHEVTWEGAAAFAEECGRMFENTLRIAIQEAINEAEYEASLAS